MQCEIFNYNENKPCAVSNIRQSTGKTKKFFSYIIIHLDWNDTDTSWKSTDLVKNINSMLFLVL